MNRRDFITRAGLSAGALVIASGADAQDTTQASNLGAMDQAASRSVRRPPKPGAEPSMTDRERDDLERKLHCQCGCTLDVYTCRTTDFTCQVSPAMHADVKALVEGGYSAQEILDSFVDTYGERALMAPRAQGFNIVGYVAPFIAFAAGIVAVGVVLRNWRAKQMQPAPVGPAPVIAATPDEMARLTAALRDDS